MTDEELEEEGRRVYAEIAEACRQNEKALQDAIAPFGSEVAEAVKDFRSDQTFTEFVGIVGSAEVQGDRQESEYETFDHEYINQTTNGGYTGDEFAGTIYFPLSDTQYLAMSYVA